MKADEMFEELRYEKIEENVFQNEVENIEYRKTIEDNDFSTIIKIIEIYNPKFYIKPFVNLVVINTDIMQKYSFDLSLQELDAINEKVKELRLEKQLNKEIKSIKEDQSTYNQISKCSNANENTI